MKPFPNSAILAKFLATANIQVALDLLDTMLKTLDTPAVDGDMINTFANFNLTKISSGIYKIAVNTLETQTAIGTLDPVYLRKHPTIRKIQASNDGTTWIDVGSGGDMNKATYDPSDNGYVERAGMLVDGGGNLDAAGIRALIPAAGGGDMLKATYDAPNNGYVERAGMLVDGGGNLDAAGIRALIPAAGADPRIQEITAFFALVRGFLATSTTGFLQLPGGIVDAFLSTDANISTGANYQLTSGLTQIDPDVEMSVDLVPIYVSGTPTKGTLMLMYGGDVSKFGLAYTWGGDWFYVNGAGDGLIRTFSTGADTLNILYRTFDLEGTVAGTVTPRLYVYELAGTFQILGAQLVLW